MSNAGPIDSQFSESSTDIPDVSIDAIASRVAPRQTTSGVTRGTQTIAGTDGSTITLGAIGSTAQIGIGQYDSNTLEVSQYGQQADGSSGLKFFDANGVGIAQFIRDTAGNTSIKVASPNIEVGIATDAELVFNSNKSFTVALQDSYTFPSLGAVTTGTTAVSVTKAIPHNVGSIPDASVFAPFTVGGFALPGLPTGFPQTTAFVPITSGALVYQSNLSNSQIVWGVDATNLYLGQVFSNDESTTQTALPITVYYTVFTLKVTAVS